MTSPNKPCLFSELKELLMREINENLKIFCPPAFNVRNNFYLSLRLLDCKDSLSGVYLSLKTATKQKIDWMFCERGKFLIVSYKFKKQFDDFDIKTFCEKLCWAYGTGNGFGAGFPFLEALLENGRGKFIWRYSDASWKLEISIPVLKN